MRLWTAMQWRVMDCMLPNGREVEMVDVPGHRDYLKPTILVRPPPPPD
jgi:hypothetical protein